MKVDASSSHGHGGGDTVSAQVSVLVSNSAAPTARDGEQETENYANMSSGTSDSKKILVYGLGIFVCYFYFGILHEKITRSTYGEGETQERYTCVLSLVFFQCVVSAIFGKILLSTFMKEGPDPTRRSYYATIAFTYLTAMVSTNMALQHINYPTQVIGKSCKPIPVMVLGVLLGRKQYPLKKYLFVLLIVIGIGIFMYKDGKTSSVKSTSLIGMGEILLLVSLTMDGLTAACQERMKSEYRTKPASMMLGMNLWSTFYLGTALIVTGELWEFVGFIQRYPYVIHNIITFALMSSLGQMFIFLVVSEFGPLPCSIITTTRKFFTVLGSVILFGNTLLPRQWLGTVFVFTGLILDSFYGKAPPEKKQ